MCGIAAFISSNPKYNSTAIVNKMLDHMAHRGPNGRGVEKIGETTIGMVRLSIIDVEPHDIPISNERNTHSIVYNGEIYNHEELYKKLSGVAKFRTKSDAETVLHAYSHYGDNTWNMLNGMFSIAITDRVSGETVIVRDRSGEKPLYYCKGKDFYAFSSEIKALLDLIEPQLNEHALSYQAYEFTFGEETLFKGIYALPPGEWIKVSANHFRKQVYWKIWDELIDLSGDTTKLKNQLTELLYDAVQLRTNSTCHDVGIFMGGGVDSALIACMSNPDHLYTCHYALGADFDELYYAQLVAKQLKKRIGGH